MGWPEPDITGIELIDMDKDFCKQNCRWVNKEIRRSMKDMPGNKCRRSKSSMREPVSITISLEKAHLDYIKRLALLKSHKEGRAQSPNRLIREALEEAMPCPKTMDMLGKRGR